MINALRSEGSKLRRPGMLLGGIGTCVGMGLLITILIFATAVDTPHLLPEDCTRDPSVPPTQEEIEAARNASDPRNNRGPQVSFCALQKSNGMLAPFGFGGSLLGVVAVVLAAQSMGAEYSQGTLKVALSREPRRLLFLAGKGLALAVLLLLAVVASAIFSGIAAIAVASARGIATDAWFTGSAMADYAALVGRTWIACLGWQTIGLFLAVLLRSAAPAVGIGIGYTIVGEPILGLALGDNARWLPGRVLNAWTTGGVSSDANAVLGTFDAGVLLLVYTIIFAVAASWLLHQRDVTT